MAGGYSASSVSSLAGSSANAAGWSPVFPDGLQQRRSAERPASWAETIADVGDGASQRTGLNATRISRLLTELLLVLADGAQNDVEVVDHLPIVLSPVGQG